MKPIQPVPNNAECERVLTSDDIGVLVMCRDSVPYAVPMNYAFVEGKLYFHCAPEGRKLDLIRANPQVCFVVDHELTKPSAERPICHPDWESVVVFGRACVIEQPEELREAFTRFGRRFSSDFVVKEDSLETTRAIILDIDTMTVRRETEAGGVEYWSWSPTP